MNWGIGEIEVGHLLLGELGSWRDWGWSFTVRWIGELERLRLFIYCRVNWGVAEIEGVHILQGKLGSWRDCGRSFTVGWIGELERLWVVICCRVNWKVGETKGGHLVLGELGSWGDCGWSFTLTTGWTEELGRLRVVIYTYSTVNWGAEKIEGGHLLHNKLGELCVRWPGHGHHAPSQLGWQQTGRRCSLTTQWTGITEAREEFVHNCTSSFYVSSVLLSRIEPKPPASHNGVLTCTPLPSPLCH